MNSCRHLPPELYTLCLLLWFFTRFGSTCAEIAFSYVSVTVSSCIGSTRVTQAHIRNRISFTRIVTNQAVMPIGGSILQNQNKARTCNCKMVFNFKMNFILKLNTILYYCEQNELVLTPRPMKKNTKANWHDFCFLFWL